MEGLGESSRIIASVEGETMKIDACRSCGEKNLLEILTLGSTPLANALLSEDQLELEEPKFPLDLVFCPHCALVQITETIPPEVLFRNYVYFSSVSDTVVENARTVVERMLAARALDANNLVVEIASNDGYLLQFYKQAGVKTLGIEPAVNIALEAEKKGIPTLAEFFNLRLARQLRKEGIQADVFHANNVLAHVADLNGVVGGMSVLLKERGVGVIEFPYVKDLIDEVEFDTIYHEHLCYFSLTSVEKLFNRHGMKVIDVERLPIHGGSLRLFVGLNHNGNPVSENVTVLLEEEQNWGVENILFYRQFSHKIEALRLALVGCLSTLKKQGFKVAAYGASAKGTTLLSMFGIGSEWIDYVVDRSPFKQGKFTPGTRLPIFDPCMLNTKKPDYVLLLTWNFVEEILQQQEIFRQNGGKFIIPIPRLEIL